MRQRWREKKLRGWRAKQFYTVKITQITENGFLLYNEGEDFYIRRKQFPWFIGASDKEIRDVSKCYAPNKDGSNDNHLCWGALDFDLLMKHVRYPETLRVYNVYVRQEDREDLYEQHVQWLMENGLPVPQRRMRNE
jgi:hypothetical protein